jgi:hypothetical protein
MVNFLIDEEEVEYNTCPAKILAFIKFRMHGFPTPSCSDIEQQVDQSSTTINNTVYAVIHTASNFVSWKSIDTNFIAPFCLGDFKSCVYIVNANTISDPLFVCKNYGKDGRHYLCTSPYRRWGNYFRNQLH